MQKDYEKNNNTELKQTRNKYFEKEDFYVNFINYVGN